MNGVTRLYVPASALALAGMAWRIGWLAWLDRIEPLLLSLVSALSIVLFVLAILTPFIGLAALITWLSWRLMRGVAFLLTPAPSRSAPEKQP